MSYAQDAVVLAAGQGGPCASCTRYQSTGNTSRHIILCVMSNNLFTFWYSSILGRIKKAVKLVQTTSKTMPYAKDAVMLLQVRKGLVTLYQFKPKGTPANVSGHNQTQSQSHLYRHSQMPRQMTHGSWHMTQCLLAVGQGGSCASHKRDPTKGDSSRQFTHTQKPRKMILISHIACHAIQCGGCR